MAHGIGAGTLIRTGGRETAEECEGSVRYICEAAPKVADAEESNAEMRQRKAIALLRTTKK